MTLQGVTKMADSISGRARLIKVDSLPAGYYHLEFMINDGEC